MKKNLLVGVLFLYLLGLMPSSWAVNPDSAAFCGLVKSVYMRVENSEMVDSQVSFMSGDQVYKIRGNHKAAEDLLRAMNQLPDGENQRESYTVTWVTQGALQIYQVCTSKSAILNGPTEQPYKSVDPEASVVIRH